MPLASTLLVLLKRGATCRSPSSSKDRPATSIRQGLTRSPTSVAALVRNSLENLVLLGQMRSIRGCYRGLVPEAGGFFDPPEADVLYQAAVETIGLRASPGQALFTGASVVAAINSILGGAGLALLAGRLGHLGGRGGVDGRGAAAVLVFGLYLGYQQQRVADLRRRS